TINGEVKQYDEKKSALSDIINQINILIKEQESLDEKINRTLAKKQKLEKNKESLSQFQSELTLVEEKIKNLNELIEANNEELKAVVEALEIVDKNKIGYMKYQENTEKISQYEQKFSKFLSIENVL